MSNIFEAATRKALRFATERGPVTVEQLWQMPLQAKNLFDLDSVAKDCNAKVKSFAEESFVTPTNTPAKPRQNLLWRWSSTSFRPRWQRLRLRLRQHKSAKLARRFSASWLRSKTRRSRA